VIEIPDGIRLCRASICVVMRARYVSFCVHLVLEETALFPRLVDDAQQVLVACWTVVRISQDRSGRHNVVIYF
jgi:hypothetical protein